MVLCVAYTFYEGLKTNLNLESLDNFVALTETQQCRLICQAHVAPPSLQQQVREENLIILTKIFKSFGGEKNNIRCSWGSFGGEENNIRCSWELKKKKSNLKPT